MLPNLQNVLGNGSPISSGGGLRRRVLCGSHGLVLFGLGWTFETFSCGCERVSIKIGHEPFIYEYMNP